MSFLSGKLPIESLKSLSRVLSSEGDAVKCLLHIKEDTDNVGFFSMLGAELPSVTDPILVMREGVNRTSTPPEAEVPV
jgi:hypothetical protein